MPITAEVILIAKNKLAQVGEKRFDGVFDGVNPEIRDEFVREQHDKAAAQRVEAARHVETVDNSAQQVETADKLAQPVEDARDSSVVAAADIFVTGEIITVVDQQSKSQVDESQVLVQPADAVYCEVGQHEIEGSDTHYLKVKHPKV